MSLNFPDSEPLVKWVRMVTRRCKQVSDNDRLDFLRLGLINAMKMKPEHAIERTPSTANWGFAVGLEGRAVNRGR